MRAFLARLKAGTEHLNYGRDTVASMAARRVVRPPDGPVRIVDLGLGTAADLLNVARALEPAACELAGVECHPPYAASARERGIDVHALNLERDALPWDDGSVDLVVANQVLEHCKEIFWIAAEVVRVLKPGGLFIVGVPNLASLHSRVMLALGMQPSPIDVLGPHVRGFTPGGLARFLGEGGFLEVVERRGGNYYPFPPSVARPLARLLPGSAVSLFLACERTPRRGSFLSALDARSLETPFYRG